MAELGYSPSSTPLIEDNEIAVDAGWLSNTLEAEASS